MLKVKVVSDTKILDGISDRVLRNTEQTLSEVCDSIITDIRENWYKGEPPSARGGPPRKVTGNLDRSLKKQRSGRDAHGRFVSRKNGAFWVIEAQASYAGRLELGDLDRPFLGPAVDRAAGNFSVHLERIAR